MKYYAGIGSRKTPVYILHGMTRIAEKLRETGWTLRSGGAFGADKAFEAGAENKKEIYTAKSEIPPWAFETVDKFHPAPHRLKEYVRRLHARNAMILLGTDQANPVKFICCWTPNGEITGGTGQALRIAEHYGIEVRNLALPKVREEVKNWINSI